MALTVIDIYGLESDVEILNPFDLQKQHKYEANHCLID